MKVATSKINKRNLTAYIPPAIREALNVMGGDTIEWHVESDRVIVRKETAE